MRRNPATPPPIDWAALVAAARAAAARSYSPYSHYAVGAALLAEDGRVFTGCNVENASYGLTNCAERTALFKAVSEGARRFRALAIAGGTARAPALPCGACRQVIAEFRIPHILMANLADDVKEMTLEELLPGAFSAEDIIG